MKKIKRVREIKTKIKILKETEISKEVKHEKEIENFVEESPSIPAPERTNLSAEQNVPQTFQRQIPQTNSQPSNNELEHQSRNFYTSGLAAREERRNYISEAPRIALANRNSELVRRTPSVLDTSRNVLQNDSRQEVFGEDGKIAYYQPGKKERKSVTDWGE